MPVIGERPGIALDKIMLATDFSPVAEKAGEYAKALALRYHAKLGIAYVCSSFGDDGPTALLNEQQVYTQQRSFQEAGIRTTFAQSSGCPVADELLLLERQFGPDMIVMGTQSKNKLDRLLIGSTAEKLVRKAQAPVLTVGPKAKSPKSGQPLFQRIVLATDLGAASAKALELALSLAQDTGAHLSVLHVLGKEEPRSDDEGALESHTEEALRARLQRLIPPEALDWCTPEYSVGRGNAAQAILTLMERVDADLIVMGARRPSFRLLHLERGVTQDVLASATCPILTAC